MRSRVDIFLQYWLTMRMKDEIASDGVFRRFREHALECMTTSQTARLVPGAMRRDADTFRSFAQLDRRHAGRPFYARVVESFELAATTPLLLWMLSENHRVPDAQVEVGLGALESWVIRRTLLRMTMKDVNKLMVAILGTLETGRSTRRARRPRLPRRADGRCALWPTDADMLSSLPDVRLYGNVRQSRLRVVLAAIEKQLRTERHEDVTLPEARDRARHAPRLATLLGRRSSALA